MGFRVNLYSMEKKSNSTELPSGDGLRVTCNTNTQLDLMQPVFPFEITNAQEYNYLYVNEWRRYYWVDKWVWDNGLWLAYCHIDPLASWRTEIGNMTEYVLRSQYSYNGDIVDTTYPLSAEVTVVQTEGTWHVDMDPADAVYVVGIVGGNGLTRYYAIDDIAAFGAAMFSDTFWDNVVADDPGVIEGNIPTFMKAQFNPLQYVVSCMWFPFGVQHSLNTYPIKLGYFDSGYNAYLVGVDAFQLFQNTIEVEEHPQASSRGEYLNLAPYTRMRLSALPWGEIDLDTTKFANIGSITLEAWVDSITGSSKLYIKRGDTNQPILTLVGQVGVAMQLSQVLKDNLATVTGAASAAAGIVSSLFGGPLAAAGGIASAISGIGNAVAAQYPDVSTTGYNGARISVCPTKLFLTQTFQMVVGEDRQNHGRPLCQRVRLGSIPGYIMIADPDVELPATQEEIDQIKQYMVNGFFYE